ncbi:MAG TPA: ADP-ribosylglycohydrolase family protein [Anaerolineaceae bacterium]|nr:ADP-ribosylglycohydrolase family protein [Anaerolineaceae bacterium]
MTERENKILGSLLGAAVGDSMGAATETRSTDMIIEKFGGLVVDFVEPPDDNLARGTEAGVVTDDFSVAYYTAEEILATKSPVSKEIAEKALLHWSTHPEYTRYIGPTTQVSISKIKGDLEQGFEDSRFQNLLCNNKRATNGAGMKAGIMGLFNPCDLDRAIDDAITMCLPTHDNTIALSGGCAIAAATSKAMSSKVSYMEVIEAGIYGASEGYKKSKEVARPVAGADIEKKIRLAVELGLKYQDNFEKSMRIISEIIGGGLYAYEAIPAVFGHIAACKGETMESILMGVNGGDDTDTVACMTGYIVGALNGAEYIPQKYLSLINGKNNFCLEKMALNIVEFTKEQEKLSA